MNEEQFRKLYEEYKKLKAKISPRSSAQDKGMSRQFLQATSVLRFGELEKILRDEGTDYLYLLSAGDRLDIRKNN